MPPCAKQTKASLPAWRPSHPVGSFKSISGKAVTLATLFIVFAGSILLAQAARERQAEAQTQVSPSSATQAAAADRTEWMLVPRGSLIDAAL